MTTDRDHTAPGRAPLAELERAFIEEFVRARGHDPSELPDMPPIQRELLLKDAGFYASAKLAEMEARSHFVDEIVHDVIPDRRQDV